MLVSVEELQDYMSSIGLSADQSNAIEMILEGVQSELETYLNRPVELTDFVDEVAVVREGYLITKATPVTEIVSVMSGDSDITSSASIRNGMIWVGDAFSGDWEYTVSYTGGLDGTTIKAFPMFILRVAAREAQNRHDDAFTPRDLDKQEQTVLPEGPQEEDYMRVRRYKRRVVR